MRTDTFHNLIRDWVKLKRLHGSDINKCRRTNKYWSPEEKYELVCQALFGQGLRSVAITITRTEGSRKNKMDAPCKIQRSIHVFRLVNNMCPGKWVHINMRRAFTSYLNIGRYKLLKNIN